MARLTLALKLMARSLLPAAGCGALMGRPPAGPRRLPAPPRRAAGPEGSGALKLGIVIPAYNAAGTLGGVLARLPAELPPHRLFIVDDGSQDGTSALAAELCRQRPGRTLLSEPRNRGYGGAMKQGLAAAREAGCRVVACLHADGQYAPERLPGMLEALARRGLDLLQGSRIASGTALSGGMPLYKYVGGRLLTWLENRVLRLRLSDYHSGYLIYGSRALDEIPFARLSESFDFDLEVLACAAARRLRVGEEPVPTRYAGERSYLRPVPYGARVLAVLGKHLCGRYRPRRAHDGSAS